MALSSLFFGTIQYSTFNSFRPGYFECHYLVLANEFFLRQEKQQKRFLTAKLLRIYYVLRLSVSYCVNVKTSQKWLAYITKCSV